MNSDAPDAYGNRKCKKFQNLSNPKEQKDEATEKTQKRIHSTYNFEGK